MFFVTVLFLAYEARLIIFNKMSFGKTFETKLVFFYKHGSLRHTSITKTRTVHQPMIILKSRNFKTRLPDNFWFISLFILFKLTLRLLFLSLFFFFFS